MMTRQFIRLPVTVSTIQTVVLTADVFQLFIKLKENQIYVPKRLQKRLHCEYVRLFFHALEYIILSVPSAPLLHRQVHNILTAVWVVKSKDDGRNLLLVLLLD